MELAGQPMYPPQHIYGIDFSGAQDAGKKIWTSKGILKGEILCENSSKAERHPLQNRTPSSPGCVGDIGLIIGVREMFEEPTEKCYCDFGKSA